MIQKTVKIDEVDISNDEIRELITKGRSFDFLSATEEDIYSDDDLKIITN